MVKTPGSEMVNADFGPRTVPGLVLPGRSEWWETPERGRQAGAALWREESLDLPG